MTDLERRLLAAAGEVDWPDVDVSTRVSARVRALQPRRLSRWLRPAIAVAALVLILFTTPFGRDAVANVFELAGIRVAWLDSDELTFADLELGREVSLQEAFAAVDFELLTLSGTPLGDADSVYLFDVPPATVHQVWLSDDALPASGDTGVGLLYSQFRGTSGELLKGLGEGTTLERVVVRGNEGAWIEGAPHTIEGVGTGVRLAANVLFWEEEGVSHRIETTLGLEEALAIADGLQE